MEKVVPGVYLFCTLLCDIFYKINNMGEVSPWAAFAAERDTQALVNNNIDDRSKEVAR